jgi:TetR/AcrR family transcriptional repressor of nem operon
MTSVGTTTRERILDAAFALSTADRSTGISMRRLADRCGLNVATIYHHFPSKADLLRAVLEERGYPRRIGEDHPPAEVASAPSPSEAVRRLLGWLWQQAEAEESAWRLLIGEGLRGEPGAREEANRLVELLGPAVSTWLGEVAPDLGSRREPVARVVRSMLLSLAVEHLALGPDDARARARIDDLVAALRLD